MNNYQHLSNAQLIGELEMASIFEAFELEAELNHRLERTGQRWRFTSKNNIELYYPEKVRPGQKSCDIGLFDLEGRKQMDLADLLLISD